MHMQRRHDTLKEDCRLHRALQTRAKRYVIAEPQNAVEAFKIAAAVASLAFRQGAIYKRTVFSPATALLTRITRSHYTRWADMTDK